MLKLFFWHKFFKIKININLFLALASLPQNQHPQQQKPT